MTQPEAADTAWTTVLAALPFGLWVIGPDRRLVFASTATAVISGLHPDAVLPGMAHEELVRTLAYRGVLGPGDPEALAAEHLRLDRSRPLRRRVRRTDGASFELTSTPLPGGGFVSILQEVTGYLAAAEEAQAQARRLETLLSRLHGGIAVYDQQRRASLANPAYEDLLGLPRGTIRPGTGYEDLFRLLGDRGEFANQDTDAVVSDRLRLDRTQPMTYQRVRPNGQVLRFDSQPLPEGGHMVEIIDITAVKQAEDEAQRRAALLDGVLASLPLGVVVYGPDGRVAMVNAAHQAIMAGSEVRVGEHRADIARRRAEAGEYGPGDPAELARQHLNAPPHHPAPAQRIRADGTALDIRYAPLPDGGAVQVITDITALHAARTEATARAGILQVMLDNIRHGIALYDRDRRLVALNRLALSLSDTPEATHGLGRTLEELLAVQHRAGAFGTGPAAEAEYARIRDYDRSRPIRYQRRTLDGKVIEIRSDPTPEGGFVVSWTDVTALAEAEEAAEQRAVMLQLVLDSMRHGFVFYDAAARLVAANALGASYSSLPPEDMVPGRPLAELLDLQRAAGAFGPEPGATALVAQLLALDRNAPYEYRRSTPEGRILEIRSAPSPDGGFVITQTDVTALAEAEAAARERATLLQTMQDSMRHGLALFSPDKRLILANRLAAGLAGIPDSDLVPGMTVGDMVQCQLARGVFGEGPEAEAEARQVAARDRRLSHPMRRHLADGRVIDSVSDPTPDGGFVITWTDVTALVRAETDAGQRAATLQAMIDNMHNGVALFGPDRRLVASNRLIAEMVGLPEAAKRPGVGFDTLAEALRQAGSVGDPARDAALADEALQADRSRPQHHVRPTRDGRMLEVFSDPMPDGGFVVTMVDITPLARAEREAKGWAATQAVMLDVIRHGIALFGPDRRLVAANRLASEHSGVAPDLMQPGMLFDDAVADQLQAGVLGSSTEAEEIVRRALAADRSRSIRYQRRTRDGRLIEVVSDPTSDGGFAVTYSDITALAEAEASAASRAAMLQAALDNMRHGLLIYGPDLRLRAANALAADLAGLPAEEVVPGAHLEALLQRQRERGQFGPEPGAEAAMQSVLTMDKRQHTRRLRQTPDGRHIEIFTDPTPDGGFVVSFTDITARARAEAEAQERAGILQVMLDNMRHGICYYGPDRRLIAANALAATLGGYPPDAMVRGTSIDTIIDRQLENRTVGGDDQAVAAMARGLDRSKPARYLRPNADGRIIEVTSDPTPDGGFVVTLSDISPLAKAEAEAQRRAGMLQAMLDHIRHGIALFDAAGQVLAVNPVFRALLELPEAVVAPGASFAAFIDHMQARGEYGEGEPGMATAAALKARDRRQSTRSVRTRPNGMVLEIASEPVPGGGWVLALTDVTEDRRVRAELERAKDAAEAANRAKSRFLATMTHELRTPLNAVIGFSEALTVDPDPVRGKEYVRSIHEAGRHLLTLIDDILDVTRAETTGFAITEGAVEVAPLVEGTVRVMQATAANAGVAVRAALPPALPLLRADEVRLRQVLLNLVSNAVKFTPQGGTVTLSAEEEAGDLVLRVSDSGIGIAPEDIPRAFEPFTQLDSSLARRFPGSGLGLYLSRALAEAQGATLTLESTPGAGTTAVLRFPKSRLLTSLAA